MTPQDTVSHRKLVNKQVRRGEPSEITSKCDFLLAFCVIGHHGRSKSEVAVPVSLSAESSSVSAGGGPQPSSTKSRKGSTSSNQSGPPGNLAQLQNRVSRTVSRNDDEDQVSAV